MERKLDVDLWQFENRLRPSYAAIAGVDEAGRGPVAGPIYAAAVILRPEDPLPGLNDSKKLSPKKRLALFSEIQRRALAYHIVSCTAEDIDRMGIARANRQVLLEAVRGLQPKADYVLSDFFQLPELSCPYEALVKGDARSASIAAASIMAKVSRDQYMEEVDRIYPNYGFARHKGYGTHAHRKAIEQQGLCPEHRRSFLRKWGFA